FIHTWLRFGEIMRGSLSAQDHLMTSMLARELITELIELHEKLKA
ncbi:PTS lactose/cellobiose transporter subunit IIA, partial [Escherichia coli]|nr:PTS lactose/cellobiose transporter subunit IIA [Escherichia coli]